MPFCFWNALRIGSANRDFQVNGNGKTIATTVTRLEGLLNDLLADLQSEVAACRVGLSSTGHVTLDSNGGANFSVTWTDTPLRDLLGFTGNLAAANSYIAPRRVGGAWYATHGGGPLAATLQEHDPQPGLVHVSQTFALSGLSRTSRSGVRQLAGTFDLRNLDNSARYVSPAGATGTTYASAAATDPGLTSYLHARERWYDSTDVAQQGYSDGREVYYFATAPSWSPSGAPQVVTPTSAWVVLEDDLRRFGARKEAPPKSHAYRLTLAVRELLT